MDDELSAHSIMAVNPDTVTVTPAIPMSRDPNVISATIPVAGTMRVVGSIPNVDTDPNRIRDCSKTAQAKQCC
jgi:hypothetical protein